MNINKSKILLKKINALHDSGVNVSGGFSSLEKDLLLQYVRELYEALLEHSEFKEIKNGVDHPTIYAPPSAPTPSSRVAQPEFQTPSPPVYIQAASQKLEEQQPFHVPNTVNLEHAVMHDPAIEDLFEINHTSTSRFGELAVQDLSRAFSINEKILTINELFGGNQQVFSTTIDTLNRMKSLEEAKIYLTRDIATKYAWSSATKRNKAQQFIQLVRRRYS